MALDDTPGRWENGAGQPIGALSPDTIERMAQSPAWIEICRMADEELKRITDLILDPKTADEEATKRRHALAMAKQFAPQEMLSQLRARHRAKPR